MFLCKVCGKSRSPFILHNKTVCLRCDELLFDMEIECEEDAFPVTPTVERSVSKKTRPQTVKGKTRA